LYHQDIASFGDFIKVQNVCFKFRLWMTRNVKRKPVKKIRGAITNQNKI